MRIFLASSLSLLVLRLWFSYEKKFYEYEKSLVLVGNDFSIGDTITMQASISSDTSGKVELYENRTKSFALYVYSTIGDKLDLRDYNFSRNDTYGTFIPINSQDKVEAIHIEPNQDFRLNIEGSIKQGENGGIIFDFGQYGIFPKDKPGRFLVIGLWRPSNLSSSDSEGAYATESVYINVYPKNK